LLLGLVGCGSVNPQSPPEAPEISTYRVGAPDQLEITVLPEPAIARSVRVRPDGRISFDLIGDIVAAGRTTTEIAQEIEGRIAHFKRDASVSVVVALSQTDSITIFGEVKVPGSFPLERATRLAEAIGLRGGPTIFASNDSVRVIRVINAETYVLLADIGAIQRGDLATNIMLQGGDIVVVPPNIMAKIGYAIQNVLFPFTPLLTPAFSATSAAGGF
jgi:polysaccharide export outer membrane protein